MTPELKALWQRGKLDARCRSCGDVMAATSWCYRCYSRDLEYIPHAGTCLASGGGGTITPQMRAMRSLRHLSADRTAAMLRSGAQSRDAA